MPATGTGEDVYRAIEELRERVTRLEERVDIITRELESIDRLQAQVSAMSQKVDDIDKKLDEFMKIYMKQLTSNHRMLKFVLMLIGMILSFLAALFGLHWYPP